MVIGPYRWIKALCCSNKPIGTAPSSRLTSEGDSILERAGKNHMCGCQSYGPFLGTLNIRGHIIIGTQKGTIILTTTHIMQKMRPD